ncbi:hypothetical protein [Halorientalis regularis]|uniref:Uncharacterized protein n=1 Tax=Halorientalis regularis TaxID=660518 RepID=A0A1G7GUL5_9EURY|nr:hypothetical protein [Halorientalis regularis]SDE91846.1 hypothetical protein SAMN05216218_102193 [Halorientalis regularis]
MNIGEGESLVDYDTGAALEVATDHAGEDLLVCAEYTPEDFRVVYLSDRLQAEYDDLSEVVDAGEVFHHYGQLDFMSEDQFAEFYPTVSETQAFVAYTDFAIIGRVVGANEGFYLSVAQGTEITPLVDAVTEIVR